ncbi:uncharacterized protein ATNIH1004_001975 [Aspergillus tanneri]|uniref:Uncharacterized protein n=1 Tax=Aspergillus tanneri TaxID=1220188 RepID=A0A5M9M8X1_9EURO|nr:uncharacterized protein ATNIH1004_001975 [Aspergillus tanneri]KAA8641373.1 hypothetical protein ATNIH1004_001975 [Aspergillus tanneri]
MVYTSRNLPQQIPPACTIFTDEQPPTSWIYLVALASHIATSNDIPSHHRHEDLQKYASSIVAASRAVHPGWPADVEVEIELCGVADPVRTFAELCVNGEELLVAADAKNSNAGYHQVGPDGSLAKACLQTLQGKHHEFLSGVQMSVDFVVLILYGKKRRCDAADNTRDDQTRRELFATGLGREWWFPAWMGSNCRHRVMREWAGHDPLYAGVDATGTVQRGVGDVGGGFRGGSASWKQLASIKRQERKREENMSTPSPDRMEKTRQMSPFIWMYHPSRPPNSRSLSTVKEAM